MIPHHRLIYLGLFCATVVAALAYGHVLADIVANGEIKVDGDCPSTGQDCLAAAAPEDNYVPVEECGIWLAPSSLPGAGLGMYAGTSFRIKEALQQSGDIVIPVIDILIHQRSRKKWKFHWDDYTWQGRSLGMGNEALSDVNAASPGFGSAANSFLDLVNVEEKDPENSPCGLDRSKDPGAGAFSTYHNRVSIAKAPITAGQELFVNYGSHWFEQRIRLGPIPLRRGLAQATLLFERFQKLKSNNPTTNATIYKELWDIFITSTVFNESRVIGAFQGTEDEWQQLEANKSLKQIRVKESIRSLEWLQNHGTCADNIRENVSTVRQAGRGAFATRSLRTGSVVAQLPLIHIGDRSVLEMYTLNTVKKKKQKDKIFQNYQLMMNYCYGHTNSTMLLCPYGPIVNMVNHNKTLQNVKLRWSDPNRGNHEPDVLNKSIDMFAENSTAKLAMDLVATRDILLGDEIFLDYGDVWENAWLKHVKDWKPVNDSTSYVSAYTLNQDKETRLRTEFELMTNPYPGNVNLKCDIKILKRMNRTLFDKERKVVLLPDATDPEYANCEILRFSEVKGTILYTAVASIPPADSKKKKTNSEVKTKSTYERLKNVPREAFHFDDRPYTTDLFLENAFRHAIMIPDDMFPEEWMNWSPVTP